MRNINDNYESRDMKGRGYALIKLMLEFFSKKVRKLRKFCSHMKLLILVSVGTRHVSNERKSLNGLARPA
jgi:hypothetical protein